MTLIQSKLPSVQFHCTEGKLPKKNLKPFWHQLKLQFIALNIPKGLNDSHRTTYTSYIKGIV